MVNKVTDFFKTLFKETKYENKAECIVGHIKSIAYAPGLTEGYSDIVLRFIVEDSGNLTDIFREQPQKILDTLNRKQKHYKMTVNLEEVDES